MSKPDEHASTDKGASDARRGFPSLRIYLAVDDTDKIDALTDRLSDVLTELGFNADPDGDLAVITRVLEADDDDVWSADVAAVFDAIKDRSPFVAMRDPKAAEPVETARDEKGHSPGAGTYGLAVNLANTACARRLEMSGE